MPWHNQVRNAYARTSQEAQDNGLMFLAILMARGWTKEACAGAWGNIGHESGYNPWRWQYDQVMPSTYPDFDTDRNHGYGLVQFTPAGKYIHNQTAIAMTGFGPNYSDITGSQDDGTVQTIIMDMIADQQPDPQWLPASYYGYTLTWTQFRTGQYTPEYLAKAWLHQYERPADQSATAENNRAQEARYWYDLWGGVVPPVPPTPTGSSKFKWWLYLRRRF